MAFGVELLNELRWSLYKIYGLNLRYDASEFATGMWHYISCLYIVNYYYTITGNNTDIYYHTGKYKYFIIK